MDHSADEAARLAWEVQASQDPTKPYTLFFDSFLRIYCVRETATGRLDPQGTDRGAVQDYVDILNGDDED